MSMEETPSPRASPVMFDLRKLFLAALAACLLSNVSTAADNSSRPCGPDGLTGPLRYLIPQGVAGADFRPACRRHDAAYEIPGANRDQVDRQFLRDMQSACQNSRRPICCRITARLMYAATRCGAGDAFALSQAIAFGRLRGQR